MLDNETKRRIDTARDILVGKVPDPKSQVEQITIALIYKFMDDMDLEAEELGGQPNFFTGEYEKYGWRKIFDPALGGHEMLGLYGDAITRMALNPNLPQLFRDIFKNAYLPYRDPETLKSFLKIIDDFNYDQSEKLGDAFEYLLSVLGSQGDAGQFRTPRHIIDFMTAILNPRKTDIILDPACGTAGFLISAYKHILRNNSSNMVGSLHDDDFVRSLHATTLPSLSDEKYQGDQLTPDDRTRLTSNIRGYDISPDMVRLSLVNLYLHGFPEPHIYEYDSLTSEDRWNEFYDVILANPPFMSPKGGIRPHKRFSVQSNRSEVLFVDFMAEHLTPGGRAAIVVPEGIIFQSGTAYKSLRKMLVEDYLVGVISLPAGVFNPYSGVKTSILWLDKSLARKTDQILFVKITADGFDLGAQRRPVKQNDLPGAFRAIQQYIDFLQTGSMPMDDDFARSLPATTQPEISNNPGISPIYADTVGMLHATSDDMAMTSIKTLHATSLQQQTTIPPISVQSFHATTPPIAATPESALQSIYPHLTLVAKSAIAENGDYNLSGERYKSSNVETSTFEIIELKEVCEILNGRAYKQEELLNKGKYPVMRVGNFFSNRDWYYSDLELEDNKYCTKGDLLFAWSASFGPRIWDGEKCIYHYHIWKMIPDESRINKQFLYHILDRETQAIKTEGGRGIAMIHITKAGMELRKIPLPPLSVQQEIVTEIESYQKIIDGARQVVENYKPRITIDPDWEMVELGEVLNFVSSGSTPKGGRDVYTQNGILFIRSQNILTGYYDFSDCVYISKEIHSEMNRSKVKLNDVFLNITGASIGRSAVMNLNIEANVNQHVALLRCKDLILPMYLSVFLNSENGQTQIYGMQSGASREALNYAQIKQLQIPLPPLETQQQIVAQIEREQALVNANKELITLMEQKIKDRISRVWGE